MGVVETVVAEHPDVDAITIFAFRPETDTNNVYSLARVVASPDNKGWDGEGLDSDNIGELLDEFGTTDLVSIELTDWDYEFGFQAGETELIWLPRLN
jgi:hypothetical protein